MVQQQNIGEALRILKQADQAAPGSANLNFNLSLLYEAEDQLIPAVDHARNYLRLAPGAIDRQDVENRIREMEDELRRNPRTVMDAGGCGDVHTWAQRERAIAVRSKDRERVQAILGILISSQRGECDKARPLADAYKSRYR
ncbi:MAG: hypothetical protein IPM25_07935 [Chloracidobacterium sp.]|nr:hypothetical protein [Chloracidobacterium sp.]